MTEVFNIKDRIPVLDGSYLVFAPHSFPKNSRWLVAQYYEDVKGFYSESSEQFLYDVTHWCELPCEPINNFNCLEQNIKGEKYKCKQHCGKCNK